MRRHDKDSTRLASLCGRTLLGIAGLALAGPAWAETETIAHGLYSTGNQLWDGAIVAGAFGLIWCLFYWGLYPRLLPVFGELRARSIFWAGLVTYVLFVAHLSSLLIYTYGFYFSSIYWILVSLIAIYSVWFVYRFSHA